MTDGRAEPVTDRPFPPERHLLRELDFEVRCVSEVEHVARFLPGPVQGAGSADGLPETELGAVLTVVDSVAGALCLRAVSPDWMATASLTFHLRGPVPSGPVELSATVLRAGRTTVVIGVEGRAAPTPVDAGVAFGEGVVTFSRLIRRDSNLTLERPFEPGMTYSFALAGGARVGAGGSLRRAVGCRVVDPVAGVTETEVVEYVRNSFGALNGGAICTIVETAALAAAGDDARITDVVLHYLSQARSGPVRTRAEVLRDGGILAVAARPGAPTALRIELFDAGVTVDAPSGGGSEQSAPMVVAHVGVCRTDPQV